MTKIQDAIHGYYKESVLYCEILNPELGDQICFLRVSKRDIGLFKLMSASNRKANKDIYDLDFITDEIDLSKLLIDLKIKRDRYNLPEHRCLFDLDHELNPLDNLEVLLEFDNIDYNELPSRPSHSNDRISIIPPNKEWKLAKSS